MDMLKYVPRALHEHLGPYTSSILTATTVVFYVHYLGSTRKVNHIPAVGSNSPILSYFYVFKFLFDAKKFVAEGFEKLGSHVIRLPGLFEWMLVVRGRDLVEEIRKAPDNILNMDRATDESLQTRFTMGVPISENPYHVAIVRNQMKRAIPQVIPPVHEEIEAAFQDYIQPPDNEWKSYTAMNEVMKVVCRASNRVFVGLPLCRNPDYIDLNIKFTVDVVKTGTILRMVPSFIRPFVSYFLPTIRTRINQGLRHLQPVIQHRRKQIELLGDEYEKPVDFLSWLMDEAKGEETTDGSLSVRILVLNFAAIHTSTMTFTQALYDLALRPENIEPLRAEAEAAVKEHGWTKAAVDKMVKIDSFIKESQRIRPMGSIMMNRMVMEDYTLSNGVKVPAGSILSVDILGSQIGSEYCNADTFDPLRFVKLAEETGKRSDITTTNTEFLAFGHGRHACPGRFFAAVELKLMMALLVMKYDVKLEKEGVRPPDLLFGPSIVPNPKAQVLFKKRA